MNIKPKLLRSFLIVSISLLILIVVTLFARSGHTTVPPSDALSTSVAAATVALPREVKVSTPPAQIAVAESAATQVQAPTGTFIFSADREGYRELYAATPATIADSSKWRQLTVGYAPARAPALSRDNTKLAFQSRRDGNWEIYVLDLNTAAIARLTNETAYDGAPTWSPDGKQIAFESYRAQNLDIWKMNADGSAVTNLTSDSETYDFAPSWSPDGKALVFTRWEPESKQLFTMTPTGTDVRNISNDRFHDEQASWSPDGKKVAFVSNREGCQKEVEATLEKPPLQGAVPSGNCMRRGIFVGDVVIGAVGTQLANIEQVSYFGRDVAPAWSPDGTMLTFVSPRPTRDPLFIAAADGASLPQNLNDDNVWITSAVWSNTNALNIGRAPAAQKPIYVEKPIAANPAEGSKYDFVGLRDVYLAPSYGIVSSAVSESFRALRNRVVAESGVDFLAQLSDMTRLINYVCDSTCDTLSWHKSGRAVDTLLTLTQDGHEVMLLVREDVNAEVYWRVYLRAAKQDGSQGEPLKEAPWNITVNARANVAPGQGGFEDEIESGYFVDFTDLAREYGWNRISAHDDVDFDWRNNREALEFWHFQKEEGLNWWQAMQEVYPPQQMADTFDWETIVGELGRVPSRTYLKDIPPSPNAWKWFALIPK